MTVKRDVTPFVGKFRGKQKEPSSETDLNAEFDCYPASDAALPQTKAFVCYTAEGQARMPEQLEGFPRRFSKSSIGRELTGRRF